MTDNVDLTLLPADNARLANLCGAMDENINHIARALSVRIKRRGEHFRVSGASASVAADALRALYSRADRGIASNDVRLQLAQPPGSVDSSPAFAGAATGQAHRPSPRPSSRTASAPRASSSPASSAFHVPSTIGAVAAFQPRTASQHVYWERIMRHSITLCMGPAGTGKTHIAAAAALELLRAAPRRLVLSRPVVEAGGERLGFLPGDMEQKVNPYLRPLHEILHQLLGRAATERRIASGEIEIIPLAFMRGLTLNNTVLILDEAQNTTPSQMKMLLTRLGENSKIIITGDTSQSDIPASTTSGLSDAIGRLSRIDDITVHRFGAGDIVRHPLVRDILAAYDGNG